MITIINHTLRIRQRAAIHSHSYRSVLVCDGHPRRLLPVFLHSLWRGTGTTSADVLLTLRLLLQNKTSREDGWRTRSFILAELPTSLLALRRVHTRGRERSNQLDRQTNMMEEFCFTNPTIVPGEELSRRGFSMYCGNDNFADDMGTKNKDINYGTYHEALSKF